MKHEIKRLEKEISVLLRQAEETDDREDRQYGKDRRGDELPKELERREERLARIKQAKRALEDEAKQNNPDDKDMPSSTKTMPMAKVKTEEDPIKGKEQVADNAQVAVDKAHQIIVSTDLSNSPTDDALLPYMVEHLPKKPKIFSADAGYGKPQNLKYMKRKKSIDTYIAVGREKQTQTQDSYPRGRIPSDLTLKQRMERKLLTKKGRRLYSMRKWIAEPPIGQIKHVQGFRQFSLRGHFKARSEWFLVTATHNLRKLFKACGEQPKRRLLLAG